MAENSYFFTAVSGAPAYSATDFVTWLYNTMGRPDGVIRGLDNALAVTADGAGNALIDTGCATKTGHGYTNTASLSKALTLPSAGYKQYTTIVVRVDSSTSPNTMHVVTIAGTAVLIANTATPASIISGTDVYLADVLTTNTSGTYTYTVTDKRVYAPVPAGNTNWATSFKTDIGLDWPTTLSAPAGSGILARLLTVDGPGSGLNADILDGVQPGTGGLEALAKAATIWASDNDGPGSGLDADSISGCGFGVASPPFVADIDAITKSGIYSIGDDNALAPAMVGGSLLHLSTTNSTYGAQIYVQSNGPLIWMRIRFNGTWQPWNKIWNSYNVGANWTTALSATYIEHDPIGTVKMFSGSFTNNSTIPGWYICDGNNGTPNLVGKFIRGGSSSGATGGSDTHTLTTTELPPHTHIVLTSSTTGTILESAKLQMTDLASSSFTTAPGPGTSTPFSILPTYYTLIFIIRLS